MIRSFFTFLSGFFFVLVTVPTVCALALLWTFFGRSLYEGEFVDEVYEVEVSKLVDEVADTDVHFMKVLSREEIAEAARKSFDVEIVREVFLAGVDKLNSTDSELAVSLMGVHDAVPVFVERLTDKYSDNLPECEEEDLEFGTNLPFCADETIDRADLAKKIASRVDKRILKNLPPSYNLRSDSFLISKITSLPIRQLLAVISVILSVFLLFVMIFTRYPYLKQMLGAVAVVFVVVGVSVLLVAQIGGGVVSSVFMGLVDGDGDHFLALVSVVGRYGFFAMNYYGLVFLLLGSGFGVAAFFTKKKKLKFGRK